MAENWSTREVDLIVADYFIMLEHDLRGLPYSKKAHRTALLPQLEGRSEGSVEFKHQNISAVLARNGEPFIGGYKPRGNYQQLLEGKVLHYLGRYSERLTPLFEAFAEEGIPQTAARDIDFAHCQEQPPSTAGFDPKPPQFRPNKVNYLEKEQNNRILGAAGEEFVLAYERWRLVEAGMSNLASLINWTAREKGDGAGYDILSKNVDGSDRFIEVKTTKLPKETPIFLTANEIAFAASNAERFYLYRVFDFGNDAKFFLRSGSYDQYCKLIPQTYRGFF